MSLSGLGDSILGNASAAMVVDVTPENRRGIQSGMSSQVGDMIYIFAPIGLTAIATATSYDAAFATVAGLLTLSTVGFARTASGFIERKSRRI
jgi:hypothetical protein